MYVTGVQFADVPKTWPQVARMIESGLIEGGSTEEIFNRLCARKCALWIAKEGVKIFAACVTENVILGGRKVCNIISIGGIGLDEWIDDISMIEAWAISNGCSAMRYANCRPGWTKILTPRGYRTKHVILEKAL